MEWGVMCECVYDLQTPIVTSAHLSSKDYKDSIKTKNLTFAMQIFNRESPSICTARNRPQSCHSMDIRQVSSDITSGRR